MKNLLNFLIKYSTWFVFAFYVLISCILLFDNGIYQQSVFLSSANRVASGIYGTATNVTGYFNLRKINNQLQENNAILENQVLNLTNQLAEYRTLINDTLEFVPSERFDFCTASVLNNSVRHPRNYFTINRGREDGIMPGMGVVDHNGIVGIVGVTGKNTARIISVLNETQHFSVKLKNTGFVGTLAWKGNDPSIAYVEEVPRHARYSIGDTIVTSGFSTAFPADIPVGTIMNRVKSYDDNYFVLKIRLAPDFKNLSVVRIIKDDLKQELDSLQTFDYKSDK